MTGDITMQSVVEKLKEIETGEVGIIVYSQMKQEYVASLNPEMSVPLASAAKVALGFCIAKWVEEKSCKWNEIIEEISFDPKEDSHIIYPHLQHRNSITLQDAVEVMIVCHDSVVANRIVQYFGGWGVVNQKIQSYF
jgi:beta-lactamase class A